jgi:hypothetical protein
LFVVFLFSFTLAFLRSMIFFFSIS